MAKELIIPSNPADRKKILDAVKEANDCLIRIDAEKDQIKAIVEHLEETFEGLTKVYLNRLIRVYHKQDIDKTTQENEDFQELYTAVVG